ncbi:inositol-3-phosphate synthase [Actinomadura rudentiformis]|uniref:Myo-inositol-1-phosphate synthase n=1 Tax=Actinomadura rudentiformis TaxID=359158 RepID=A0A6H9Z590_9ACTN|nr:inositol-3-phosphate synthase [Actinomadura rudentiformis]KAB2352438.1 myo-inositol-1-phosphate synthase [Actinomadura rudentiformis]
MSGDSRTGVWLIGARGSVATTTAVGAAAVGAGLVDPTACVTESADFSGTTLAPLNELVFGGHDVVGTPLPKRAEELARSGVIPPRLLDAVHDRLMDADTEIRAGYDADDEIDCQAATAERLVDDIVRFRERHRTARTVVINVASSEPPLDKHRQYADLEELEHALARPGRPLPPSSLYAYAALRAGCGYVDFTPSPGARVPALDVLARAHRVPYAGSDAKTGETLVKTALAPMFAARALHIRSWSGTNLLGGGDGATLADSGARRSKSLSKDRPLAGILGRPVEGKTHIDNVPSMGEWKTAWDHIQFEGFLGVPMTLQFTWQGCDSALAAPLVLDLARLVARAQEAGRTGPLPELGFFFKDPVGLNEHRLLPQYEVLLSWVHGLNEGVAGEGV